MYHIASFVRTVYSSDEIKGKLAMQNKPTVNYAIARPSSTAIDTMIRSILK